MEGHKNGTPRYPAIGMNFALDFPAAGKDFYPIAFHEAQSCGIPRVKVDIAPRRECFQNG